MLRPESRWHQRRNVTVWKRAVSCVLNTKLATFSDDSRDFEQCESTQFAMLTNIQNDGEAATAKQRDHRREQICQMQEDTAALCYLSTWNQAGRAS